MNWRITLTPVYWLNVRWRPGLALAGGLALLAHLMLLAPLPLAWRGGAALLLLGLPGFLLALVLFEDEGDSLTLVFLGLCGAIALQVLLLLALHTLPGPMPWWLVLLPCDMLSLVLGGLLLGRAPTAHRPTGAHRLWRYMPLALVLLLAALLRLPFLGSAELQGDEANVVLLAVDAVIGHEQILLLHRKGPVEVLLPIGQLALLWQLNEWAARLPFALSGIGVVLGGYVLARRMLRPVVGARGGALAGLIAAAVLALDGFLIAYSRMVQYQNVVVLMMLGAVWCGWRFYAGAPHPQRYLVCGAVLAAIAGLAHYDGGFVLLALAWLALAGAWRRGWRGWRLLGGLALPSAIYTGLLASFYIPFVLHEHFQSTLRNLMKRTGQRDQIFDLYNNLPFYERVASFYNTTFQIHWLGALLAAAVAIWLWRYGRPRWLGCGLAALLLLGCALLLWAPQRLAVASGGNWAIVAFGLPLVALALSPAAPPALRVLVLWFSLPFVAESFLIGDPKTHFYTIDAAAALLIGLGCAQLLGWLRTRRLAWLGAPVALGGAALLALPTPYLYLVFVRQTPEYRIVFPAARPDIYRASYGDTLPRDAGYFGFPHRAGWRVIGELYRQGVLRGNFESNEDYLITLWYLGRVPRCDRAPEYYFLARSPLDLVKLPLAQIQRDYHLFGSVQVDGVPQIDIYSRQPVARPRTFELSDYIDAFDARRVISLPKQRLVFKLAPLAPERVDWRGGVTLEQAQMRRIDMVAGQSTTLTFRWQAAQPLDPDDEVFVDIVDGAGRTVASVRPLCQSEPPAQWHTHDSNTTTFTLDADANIPPGSYTIRVGMRQSQTGVRLPLSNGTDALQVATLIIGRS
ncbi:MAG: glycosyltransferase family 39 protein [Roseiflexaceae bacterium]